MQIRGTFFCVERSLITEVSIPAVPFAVSSNRQSVTRPIVIGLVGASCLLSIVSWYTTEQGMALYLSTWFSLVASLGVQAALVLVAWLIGFTRTRRALLIAVYVITAAVSIGFSYVSLFTWFSQRERPLAIERKLYDTLTAASAKAEEIVGSAIAEQQKHVLALDEMTAAEKEHGFIARAEDADPYLNQVRAAVAREAQTYSRGYREGSGVGVRYSAFDRYANIARQSLNRLQQARISLTDFRGRLKPLDPTETQLQEFHRAYDAIPWSDIEQSLHNARLERPALPNYAEFVDRPATGQEDLLIAFQELFTAPTGRHVFAFALAAFIDIVVFLLAYSSGPHFFGSESERWCTAAAALDSLDDQIFVRDFLRKLVPTARGMARADAGALTPGEQQLCLLLAAKNLAVTREEDGNLYYLLDQGVHQQLLESLATQGFPFRASAAPAR
ncbi:MAG: hypothetical protein ABI165_13400 [Bryobacteraceae bacterium]